MRGKVHNLFSARNCFTKGGGEAGYQLTDQSSKLVFNGLPYSISSLLKLWTSLSTPLHASLDLRMTSTGRREMFTVSLKNINISVCVGKAGKSRGKEGKRLSKFSLLGDCRWVQVYICSNRYL